MTHYIVELILWLLLAFFIGAIIACLLRSLFSGVSGGEGLLGAPGSGVSGKADAPATAAAPLAAEEDAGADEAAQRRAEEEAARRKAEEEAAARCKAEEEARQRAEEEARRKAEEEARRKAGEEAQRKAEEEARRKAGEEAQRKAEEEARRKAGEEAKQAEATKPYGLAGPIGGVADNLTRIKGIGSKINGILNDLGIYHFTQIAAWTEKDIAEVDEKLKFKGRIVREKWVEQAKVLAEGGETEFSRRVDKGEVATSHTHTTGPKKKK